MRTYGFLICTPSNRGKYSNLSSYPNLSSSLSKALPNYGIFECNRIVNKCEPDYSIIIHLSRYTTQ